MNTDGPKRGSRSATESLMMFDRWTGPADSRPRLLTAAAQKLNQSHDVTLRCVSHAHTNTQPKPNNISVAAAAGVPPAEPSTLTPQSDAAGGGGVLGLL